MKKALILGAGGFIGSHMVNRLKSENYYVVGVDIKHPEFSKTKADKFYICDLTNKLKFNEIISNEEKFDEIYQYAADMGGAGFIFTGENDAKIMHSSISINLNLLSIIEDNYKNFDGVKIFYSSSACIYPQQIQEKSNNPGFKKRCLSC